MSKVGKKPISIPKGVEVKIGEGKIEVKGPKGTLSRIIPAEVKVELKNEKIFLTPQIETERTKPLWGTTRALIFNMVKGVTEGFEKKLEIQGLGYKALLEGKNLALYVGLAEPVKMEAPQGINFSVEKEIITVSGINKELVGEIAARIRKTKKPDPYKGKGIRYLGEVVRKKVGKKVAATPG